jgi:hypothetical protein
VLVTAAVSMHLKLTKRFLSLKRSAKSDHAFLDCVYGATGMALLRHLSERGLLAAIPRIPSKLKSNHTALG